jgi:4-amino-4-deoxy-L-arabinose transferase-like glycosyltransferase
MLKLVQRLRWTLSWERLVAIGLLIAAPFLAFYNLDYNPRPWFDEGSALSVSKTLVEDGVYAVRNLDSYQTFGPIQSVGPTVLVPIALSFRVLGVGLLQGRIVTSLYLLLEGVVFYLLGRELFDRRAALIAVILLLGSPAAAFLQQGRQALGEGPALGFFLTAWLVWVRSNQKSQHRHFILVGLLLGAAMVTKIQYILSGFVAFAIMIILDLVYYRQGNVRRLVIVGLTASACVAVWYGWQVAYFGRETFLENLNSLRQLAASTTGFRVDLTLDSIKFLFGPDSDHLYYFWGLPALAYIGLLGLKRTQMGFAIGFLVIFAGLWLAYYLFWGLPWMAYIFVPATISALFVGKLWYDITSALAMPSPDLGPDMQRVQPARVIALWAIVAVMGITAAYSLQSRIRVNVLDRDTAPQQVAAFLNQTVDKSTVIETWECELVLLTNHKYHFPDQLLLAQTHAAVYHGNVQDHTLGMNYFLAHQPGYVVVGWFARWMTIYNVDFLAEHGCLLKTIGQGEARYEIYQLNLTGDSPCP